MSKKLKDIELRSEVVKDILSKTPHWMISWGSLLFFLLMLIMLGLSWLIKYPDVIIAEAILTTEIPPQKEYARISGKIDTIFVFDKQSIAKNKVLAVLENTANYNDVYLLKSIIDTLKIDKKNVDFAFDKLPPLFLGDIESYFSQFENNYFQYIINRDLQPFSYKALANEISLQELKRRLQSLVTQRDLGRSEIEFNKKNLDRNRALFEKGVISRQEYENEQLEYLTAQKNYQNLLITISQIRESLGNAKNTSKNTEFNMANEKMRLLKNVLQAYNQLKKAVKEWELKYVLKSNIQGTVSFLNYWNSNQSVNSGDLVFTILPKTNSPYIAKLQTPNSNSGKIRLGQQVNLSLYDYPEYEYGIMRGTVSQISSTSNEKGTYIIDVAVPKELISSYNRPIDFKHEMKGEAKIITEDLRLIERILYSFRKKFIR
ncbi:HlyD family secretion protein [Zobellia sp. B3R18]|uniref:HlyD family secretion protein n=1 Tax=Zobellia sp. B3R18 TaxID=2841568 RepID=UPI001C06C45A|nr:HlyD family efflux transporter periplasmic adaptor subunit [Zobellia sp. B3R18]MBU2974963.1 HlyD family efflux transporter periplasmic adaptor subunit [Zobellia sp. B3R18]